MRLFELANAENKKNVELQQNSWIHNDTGNNLSGILFEQNLQFRLIYCWKALQFQYQAPQIVWMFSNFSIADHQPGQNVTYYVESVPIQ